MSEKLDLYKCNVCGNLVEVVLPGVGELVCCGEPMEFLEAKTNDSEFGEKHVPVFEETDDNGMEIKIGAQPHPMEKEHYIQFIETISEDKNCVQRKYLYPEQAPLMQIKDKNHVKSARDYCNIHGLWANTKERSDND